MSLVLTEKSSLSCTHQGSVKPSAKQSKLKVAGAKVLVAGDLAGAPVSSCLTVTDPNTGAVQCQAVLTAIGGVATKLKVAGKGVLLETVKGQTSGVLLGAPQSWSVKSAGQTKLKAT